MQGWLQHWAAASTLHGAGHEPEMRAVVRHETCLAQIGHLQAHICSCLVVGHGSEPEDA